MESDGSGSKLPVEADIFSFRVDLSLEEKSSRSLKRQAWALTPDGESWISETNLFTVCPFYRKGREKQIISSQNKLLRQVQWITLEILISLHWI